MAFSSRSVEELDDLYVNIQLEEEKDRGVEFENVIEEEQYKPVKGLYVKELGSNLYLFQFYHEFDINWVIDGSLWTFNRLPLIFGRVPSGGDPKAVMLNKLDLLVQPVGL
ncbi:hypothetical protein F8388_004458 [Cannabis sativa]|uniref:DUF4283 domain-containing protein n=1 Tax=Cannabis sativa TaxID=3483 RepID=A0A7J6HCB5_CANSA|nr:hypothetical protein F8388_004458 [Cannabis sativa]